MFFDCSKRKIGDIDQFAVAIGGLMYHGIQIDPAELDLYPDQGEQLLVIECFCEYAEMDELLKVLTFKSKASEEKVLPNVHILA